MAGTVLLLRPIIISRHFPVQTHPSKSPARLKPNPTRFRARSPLRSSPEQNPNPLEETPNFSFSFRSVSGLLERIRDDGISLEILYIALPAALGLAADPLTSLVDTAFVGHLGSVELAAVGVSASLFNLVSKLFNIPLLNITTSFVAEQQALDNNSEGEGGLARESMDGRKYMPAVSTSLALAAGIGILETVALTLGSGTLMNFMGIPVDSPIRVPAEEFLTLRAYGAPAVVIALAAQGTFRGFKDTKTPLYAVGAGNLLNAILDPILIFLLGLGIGGAAISTAISEYVMAFILLWKLNEKVVLVSPNTIDGGVTRYLKSDRVGCGA